MSERARIRMKHIASLHCFPTFFLTVLVNITQQNVFLYYHSRACLSYLRCLLATIQANILGAVNIFSTDDYIFVELGIRIMGSQISLKYVDHSSLKNVSTCIIERHRSPRSSGAPENYPVVHTRGCLHNRCAQESEKGR